MAAASFLQFKSSDPADIATPPTGKVRFFADSTNGDAPSYKDDAGVVHAFVAGAGAAGGALAGTYPNPTLASAVLTALAALTGAADKLPYFTGASAAALTTLTSFIRTLLDDVDAAAARTTLGLVIGTNVQAYDAELAAIAGLVSAANKVARFTGSGTADLLDFSTNNALGSSDTTIASQKAIKDYVDGLVTGGATDVMIFKGVINCSANPNYPAADAGNVYKVSAAGKIGGGSGPNVEVGDTLYCITDSTASGTHAGVGANWVIVQLNIDGAVVGPTSVTDSRIALFDGTTGKLLKDGGKLLTDLIANTLLSTLGDIIYASAANTPARLAGNTTATKKFLRSTGSGGVATAPAYDTIAEADLPISAWAALTDGATVTQDATGLREVKGAFTIGGNRTFAITGAVNGSSGLVRVTQDGTGSRTLTLPAGSKIVGGGGTAAPLSTAAGTVDMLAWEYDGTNYWWTIGKAFA